MKDVTLRFLGHTGILLDNGSGPLVIDPQFSPRLFWMNRQDSAVIPIEDLRKTQAVLISNAHPNRLDFSSYKFFSLHTPVILPQGISSLMKRTIEFPFIDLKADDTRQIGDFEITALSTPHRGARISGVFYSGALNYFLRWPGGSLFYGTDSSYGPHFAEIGERYRPQTVVLPIGHIAPKFWSGSRYLSPALALKAFEDLKAERFIPNAWGSFTYNNSKASVFLDELKAASDNTEHAKKIHALYPGDTLTLPAIESKVVHFKRAT